MAFEGKAEQTATISILTGGAGISINGIWKLDSLTGSFRIDGDEVIIGPKIQNEFLCNSLKEDIRRFVKEEHIKGSF